MPLARRRIAQGKTAADIVGDKVPSNSDQFCTEHLDVVQETVVQCRSIGATTVTRHPDHRRTTNRALHKQPSDRLGTPQEVVHEKSDSTERGSVVCRDPMPVAGGKHRHDRIAGQRHRATDRPLRTVVERHGYVRGSGIKSDLESGRAVDQDTKQQAGVVGYQLEISLERPISVQLAESRLLRQLYTGFRGRCCHDAEIEAEPDNFPLPERVKRVGRRRRRD